MAIDPNLRETVLQFFEKERVLAETRQKAEELAKDVSEMSRLVDNFCGDILDLMRETHRSMGGSHGEPLLVRIDGNYYLISGIYGSYQDLKIQRLPCAVPEDATKAEGRREIPPSVIITAAVPETSESELAKLREDLKRMDDETRQRYTAALHAGLELGPSFEEKVRAIIQKVNAERKPFVYGPDAIISFPESPPKENPQ